MAEQVTDVRGESNLIAKMAAVKLVLGSRGLCGDNIRLLNMIAWILDGEDPDSGPWSTRLFIEAIRSGRSGGSA